MARASMEGPWVQLATRIPKSVHRQLRLHCVEQETSVMEFIIAALNDSLQKKSGGGKRRKGS